MGFGAAFRQEGTKAGRRASQETLAPFEGQNLKKFWQPDEQNIIFADWYYTLIELHLGSEKSAVHPVLTRSRRALKLRMNSQNWWRRAVHMVRMRFDIRGRSN